MSGVLWESKLLKDDWGQSCRIPNFYSSKCLAAQVRTSDAVIEQGRSRLEIYLRIAVTSSTETSLAAFDAQVRVRTVSARSRCKIVGCFCLTFGSVPSALFFDRRIIRVTHSLGRISHCRLWGTEVSASAGTAPSLLGLCKSAVKVALLHLMRSIDFSLSSTSTRLHNACVPFLCFGT